MKIVQIGTNKANDDLANHLLSNYDEIEFGLFVEPNQLHIESIRKCYEKYSNAIVENIAIKVPSQNQDTLTIYYHTNDYPDYQLASCNVEHIHNHLWCPHLWRGGEGEIKSFDVSCITLEDLFEKYSITELDWLYLDVEGIDAEILLTTDWKKYKIKRIEFEHLHLGEYADQIYKMMMDMGYNQINSLHDYDWAFEKNNEKLKNFPPVHFISIEQSEDRRQSLYKKFSEYGITNIHPHIFKRYDEYDFNFVSSSEDIKITGPGIGPLTSHLKAIKDWYFDTDEKYAFFCEDDISLETVQYWNFTWEEFFNKLPSDWGCVQLCWVREYQHMFDFSIEVRSRCWCDWSACAYLISRSHAKKLISHYYRNGEFNLDYVGEDMQARPYWALKPNAETFIFSYVTKVYGFPLFVEDFKSYFPNIFTLINKEKDYNARAHNAYSYDEIMNWWKTEGKNFIP